MHQVVIAILATVVLIAGLRRLAPAIGLVDRPGGRKRHDGEVAVVGGLAMFGGYTLGTVMLPGSVHTVLPAMLSVVMLVTTGAVDDRFDLRPWTRLLVQLAATVIMVRSSGVTIDRVLTWQDGSFIGPGVLAPAFTVIAVTAAINAYNLVDGLDGLAAGLGLIAFMSFLLLCLVGTVRPQLALALAVACGPVAAFLLFNLPLKINRRMRCFMGDAGSMMIGLFVAWFGIQVSQNLQASVHPTTILWLTALPVMELFVSFGRRLAQGRPPFSADADHFHHRLLRAGLSVPAACATLLSIAATFAACGLSLEFFGVDDSVSLVLLLTSGAATSMALRNIDACRAFYFQLRRVERTGSSESLLLADTAIATRSLATKDGSGDRSV